MVSKDRTVPRQAGRPHGAERSSVHDDLLEALHACLQEKLHFEITLKEVADRAGTSPEMIRYYFGGKDGLIMALLRQISERFTQRMDALEQRITQSPATSPTRLLLRELFAFYVAERHVTRVSLSEFQKGKSKIVDDFLVDRSEVVVGRIHAILTGLVAAGRYDPAMDTRRMAVTLMTMVTGPVTFLAVLPPGWVNEEALLDHSWGDWLADLIDGRWLREGPERPPLPI